MLAAVLFGSLLLLLWVGLPLLKGRDESGLDVADEMTRERIDTLLRSLRDLYKKTPEENRGDADFTNIETGLMLKLAGIYHARGVKPEAAAAKEIATAAVPATAKAGEETGKKEPAFCPQCGKAREAHYKFCPGCGAGFRPAA